MNTTPALAAFSLALCLSALPLGAAPIVDPELATGTEAIDPLVTSGTESGTQTVDQTAPGSLSQAALEALPELGAIQKFNDWNNQAAASYIVFTDERRADVKGTYENLTGSTAGGPTTNAAHQTSDGKGIKVNSGSTKSTALVLDFGSATYSGTGIPTFDSLAKAPSAAGLTVSGLENVSTNVTVTFFGPDDTTPLYTGTIAKYPVGADPDPDAADGNTYGSDGYVGYQATGTWSGIGKIRILTNQVMGSSPGIGIDDLAFTPSGKAYYMSPSGSGTFSGTNLANALPQTQIGTTLNTTMQAGDTLYLASGSYNRAMTITTSGSAGKPKRVVGLTSGTNRVVFSGTAFNPATPSVGYPFFIKFTGTESGVSVGQSHWEFHNFDISKAVYGVLAQKPVQDHSHITFKNVRISEVRYGMHFKHCDNLTIEDSSANLYTKNGFRLDMGCDTVTFRNCVADLTSGTSTAYYNAAEAIPYGFVVDINGAPNSGIDFIDCVAKNNRAKVYTTNTQPFWNGDGFDTEANTIGVTFSGCIAINNQDAGFDCKQQHTSPEMKFTDCVSIRNGNNYKVWYGQTKFDNCVAAYSWRSGTTKMVVTTTVTASGTVTGTSTIPVTNEVNGFQVNSGTAYLNNCTILITGTDSPQPPTYVEGIRLNTSSTIPGLVSGTSCLVSFGTAFAGNRYVAGATHLISLVSSATDTMGVPVNPLYKNPHRGWNGVGDAMDSEHWGLIMGYSSTRP